MAERTEPLHAGQVELGRRPPVGAWGRPLVGWPLDLGPDIEAIRVGGTWFVRRPDIQPECVCPDSCEVDHDDA